MGYRGCLPSYAEFDQVIFDGGFAVGAPSFNLQGTPRPTLLLGTAVSGPGSHYPARRNVAGDNELVGVVGGYQQIKVVSIAHRYIAAAARIEGGR